MNTNCVIGVINLIDGHDVRYGDEDAIGHHMPVCSICMGSHKADGLLLRRDDPAPVGFRCLSVAEQFIRGAEADELRKQRWRLHPEYFEATHKISSRALDLVSQYADSEADSLTDQQAAWVLLVITGCVPARLAYLLDGLELEAGKASSATDARQSRSKGPSADVPTRGAWMGVVNTTSDLEDLLCVDIKSLGEGEYGERFLIRFEGPQGQALVWFTGVGTKFDPKVGDTYNVRAGIKEHGSYQGLRQTVITRCKDSDAPVEPRKKIAEDEDNG